MNSTLPSYINQASFDAYVTYLAIKRHFTTKNYDYYKYNGKVKANIDSFAARNDAFFFSKLSKKQDHINLILANVIDEPKIWVRDIVSDEGEQRYNKWKKKIDSLGYTFSNEMAILKDDYKSNFIVSNGQHPYLITLFLQKKLSMETFTILTHSANIFAYWEENMSDKFIAQDIIDTSRKYKPFLNYEVLRFNTLVKNRFL